MIAAQGLDETALGAFLRREGLHEVQLTEWRAAAEAALGSRPVRPGPSPEAERIRDLERELRRKDRALAETAALLVLKKTMTATFTYNASTFARKSAGWRRNAMA